MSRSGDLDAAEIVVGVDGSEESLQAVRWALREARLRGDRLVVVTVWQDRSSYDLGHPYPGTVDEQADAARSTLEVAIRAVVDEGSADAIEREVIEGAPALMLCHRAQDADLLVLGARGRGGFASLRLGSVADWCVHHSVAPVLIVPATWAERSRG
jgi:nucleotide-binding universal stress UspA family protein